MLLKKNNFETKTVENFSLIFNKLVPFLVLEVKTKTGKENFRVIDSLEKVKVNLLFKEFENYKPNREKPFIKNLINAYIENGFQSLELKTGYRLAVGLGLPSFFENGLTLHHIYGSPYIPGSSVKGLVRFTFLSYILSLFPFEEIEELENLKLEADTEEIIHFEDLEKLTAKGFKLVKELDNALTESGTSEEFLNKLPQEIKDKNPREKLEKIYNLFKELFGNLNYRGRDIFADAYATEWKFKTDIMNPHFQEYYGSHKKDREDKDIGLYLVGDWHNPVPIYFLTVENAKFTFLYKVQVKSPVFEGICLNKLVAGLLKNGLTLLGIGGKKGKGYGWFENK
jgi:CRISPR-associated protein Cmr6